MDCGLISIFAFMQAEIITIGDELVTGLVADTNSAFLAGKLNALGITVSRMVSVPDKQESLLKALDEVLPAAAIVLLTGGMGPTGDDRTRGAICSYFNTSLVENVQVLQQIRQLLAQKGFPENESNRRQALVPQMAEILPNALGTAPGMVMYHNNKIFIFLPGVPFELQWMTENRVVPFLQQKFSLPPVLHRQVLTSGAFEAQLSELLRDFEKELPAGFNLAYLPSPGVIRLRLSCYSPTNDIAATADALVEKIRKIIPEQFVTADFGSMEEYCAHLLKSSCTSLSTAESCTGGKIASMLTQVPGSSAWFKGSLVAYANEIKTSLLGVNGQTIICHGAVSRGVVEEMSQRGREVFGTDYCIATSGIAGPDGGTAQKPVGTIWISVSSSQCTRSKQFHFGDNRERNILRSSYAALNMLRKMIESDGKEK